MSIQEAVLNKHSHLGSFSKVIHRILNRLNITKQQVYRFFFKDKNKIFYPYYDKNGTHPYFLRHTKFPPLVYSNQFNASLCHFINFLPPKMPKVPYIIEANDNPLAVTAMLEPFQALTNIEKAINTYGSSDCKKIILEGEGQLALFKHYLPLELLTKIEIVRLSAFPKKIDLHLKYSNLKVPIFVCLASDYKKKAIDLLLEAWLRFSNINNSKLILACPNVPEQIKNSLSKHNVELIESVPLLDHEKDTLLKMAHVMIAPTHVDGGGNIIEAFEYGLPVITMRSQRSFIRDGNGWEVDVPFYFYDPYGYGKIWPTWKRFWEEIETAKKEHKFDNTIHEFIRIFEFITGNPEILFLMAKKSHELASGEFSMKKRNAQLLKIYAEALK